MEVQKSFEIILNDEFTILPDEVTIQVLSEPKSKYLQWWWRPLEFLTFGKRFNSSYEYKVKINKK